MDNIKSRVKTILRNDKNEVPIRIEQVLKSEVFAVLQSYLDVSLDDINVSLELLSSGGYTLTITCNTNTVKTFFQV